MDADTIRKQLREIQLQLQRVEAERAALMGLADGYESWLRVYDPKQNGFQVALPPTTADTKSKRTRAIAGTVSVRGAIRDVLMAARGSPLTSAEIWRRAEAMGARTESPTPVDLVDLNMVSIRKRDPRFRKVGVRTFAFIEGSTVYPTPNEHVEKIRARSAANIAAIRGESLDSGSRGSG